MESLKISKKTPDGIVESSEETKTRLVKKQDIKMLLMVMTDKISLRLLIKQKLLSSLKNQGLESAA
jgi:hypothetical protein